MDPADIKLMEVLSRAEAGHDITPQEYDMLMVYILDVLIGAQAIGLQVGYASAAAAVRILLATQDESIDLQVVELLKARNPCINLHIHPEQELSATEKRKMN